jgi:hypothetical protein
MGVAFGLEEKDPGLKTSIIPAERVLVKYI